jgi:hypothetical protein
VRSLERCTSRVGVAWTVTVEHAQIQHALRKHEPKPALDVYDIPAGERADLRKVQRSTEYATVISKNTEPNSSAMF